MRVQHGATRRGARQKVESNKSQHGGVAHVGGRSNTAQHGATRCNTAGRRTATRHKPGHHAGATKSNRAESNKAQRPEQQRATEGAARGGRECNTAQHSETRGSEGQRNTAQHGAGPVTFRHVPSRGTLSV